MLEKVIVRVLLAPVLLTLCVVWLVMGLVSINALGRVLERTGQNLQEYDW
jgi:hypothetical protein